MEVGSDSLRIMCSVSTSKANHISKQALALHVATKINLFSGNSGLALRRCGLLVLTCNQIRVPPPNVDHSG